MAADTETRIITKKGQAPEFVERTPSTDEITLANKIRERITSDKSAFEVVFDSMRKDAYIARHGHAPDYPKDWYRANLINPHIQNRVSSLYSKDPTVTAIIHDRMYYEVWDEDPETLMAAFQAVEMQKNMPPVDEFGMPAMPLPGIEEDFAIYQDFLAGEAKKRALKRYARGVEKSIAYYMREPMPLNFKDGMKGVVRRACTTRVGWVKIDYRSAAIEEPAAAQEISDTARRMSNITGLAVTKDNEGANRYEANLAYKALTESQSSILYEGLQFTYPESHRVIPDKNTRSLKGLVGARWCTVEYPYTQEQLLATYGRLPNPNSSQEDLSNEKTDTILVWEHFDKMTGLVYVLCDGVDGFLQEPGPLPYEIDGFFPIFALVFNEVEDPENPYPPSDVELMFPMQDTFNRLRQAQREHRDAAIPKYITPVGALDANSKANISNADAHTVVEISIPLDRDIRSVIQPVPTVGHNPDLYQTAEIYRDMMQAGRTSEAAMGGASRKTATEMELSAASQQTSVGSNVDDLDSTIRSVMRACGQIVMMCQSREKALQIVGPGVEWPEYADADILREIEIDVIGGSSGRHNAAADIANISRIVPFLLQTPGVNPLWLAKFILSRTDDKIDLNEAITPGIQSIVKQNAMAAAAGIGADPMADPNMQGMEGGNQVERPQEGVPGTAFPMGMA